MRDFALGFVTVVCFAALLTLWATWPSVKAASHPSIAAMHRCLAIEGCEVVIRRKEED